MVTVQRQVESVSVDAGGGVREGKVTEFRSPSMRGVTKYGDGGAIRGRFAFERAKGAAEGVPERAEEAAASDAAERLDARTVDGHATNATVYLTAWPAANMAHAEAATVATRDPHDVAHRCVVRLNNEPILSAASSSSSKRRGVGGSCGVGGTPRRYPRSQITSRGVAIDSMYDGLHAAHRRLAGEGMDVAGELGATRDGLASVGEMLVRFRKTGLKSKEIRSIFERHDGPRLTSAEELIAAHRRGAWNAGM